MDAAARLTLRTSDEEPMDLEDHTVGEMAAKLSRGLSRMQWVCQNLMCFCNVTFVNPAQDKDYMN